MIAEPKPMAQLMLSDGPTLSIDLRRSSRARRLTLRVSQLDGRVTLTLPTSVSEREALQFAQSKEAWLRTHLERFEGIVRVEFGTSLPFEGKPIRVMPGTGRRITQSPDEIHVPGPAEHVGRKLQVFLKTRARDRLAEASDLYAGRLGKAFSGLTLRDTRSRWGSCTSKGRIMYSWRLILAPPGILEYVAAHEVAHLEQMNHSPAFWALVEQIHGDYRQPRAWLRANGASLHRYRFAD